MSGSPVDYRVIKIGGAVLKNPDGFALLPDLLGRYSGSKLIIVVSAFSKATRQLAGAARLAADGQEHKALSVLRNIISYHNSAVQRIIESEENQQALQELFEYSAGRLRDYFKGLSITGELTLRTLDAVQSYGEFFALHTIDYFLRERGIVHSTVDSTELIVSTSDFGRAHPVYAPTRANILEILPAELERSGTVLTQGFVARDSHGNITTLGIESSNLTAVLIAEIMQATEVDFWTDVDGICTADPKLTDNTRQLDQISYDTAYRASLFGLKLIYPEMIELARKADLRLNYYNAFKPGHGPTVVHDNSETQSAIITYVGPLDMVTAAHSNPYDGEAIFSINDSSQRLMIGHGLAGNKMRYFGHEYYLVKVLNIPLAPAVSLLGDLQNRAVVKPLLINIVDDELTVVVKENELADFIVMADALISTL